MGQKVNPNGIRLGINRTWSSRWYSKSEYSKLLHEDLNIKKFIEKKLKKASISKINIERAAKKLRISIFSSRPGIIIGEALPLALGLNLFIDKLLPTNASLTNKLSMFSCLLFSAFATAAFKTFKTFFEILF